MEQVSQNGLALRFVATALRSDRELVIRAVPALSNKYRDRVCKNIEMTEFYHTIMNFPELDPGIFI